MKKIETIYQANEAAETTMDAAADMAESMCSSHHYHFSKSSCPYYGQEDQGKW
jgi:hypothetical protein